MNKHSTLTITEEQYAEIRGHLFPGDGSEAVAFVLCGRRADDVSNGLLGREILKIPYAECLERTPCRARWQTSGLIGLLEEAASKGMGLLKIHSHPTGFPSFSEFDDNSDRELFSSVYGWMDNNLPHGSAIMLPDGQIFGRCVEPNGDFRPLSAVKVVGESLRFWFSGPAEGDVIEPAKRIAQTFGKGTYNLLRRLKVAVVGCSGTGSPVIEQIARNCIGKLLLVDPKRVEKKNLNRILNATMEDARKGILKVDVFARAIAAMELGTKVELFPLDLFRPEVVRAVAGCDIIFGCMDSIDGRHLLNRLSSFYLIPYFDLGVKLQADGKGGIEKICGTSHYIRPGGSSLLSRGVYTVAQLSAVNLRRTDPQTYSAYQKKGYIAGIREDQPAVISVNMLAASLAVNELLARIHAFRQDPNDEFAIHGFSLTDGFFHHEGEGKPCPVFSKHLGRGDITPLLDMPELSEIGEVA